MPRLGRRTAGRGRESVNHYPPRITERIVEEALARGIDNIWMQPGTESPQAVARAREASINVIANGSCLLEVLGFQDF